MELIKIPNKISISIPIQIARQRLNLNHHKNRFSKTKQKNWKQETKWNEQIDQYMKTKQQFIKINRKQTPRLILVESDRRMEIRKKMMLKNLPKDIHHREVKFHYRMHKITIIKRVFNAKRYLLAFWIDTLKENSIVSGILSEDKAKNGKLLPRQGKKLKKISLKQVSRSVSQESKHYPMEHTLGQLRAKIIMSDERLYNKIIRFIKTFDVLCIVSFQFVFKSKSLKGIIQNLLQQRMSTEAENTSNFDTPAKEKEYREPESTNAKWGESQIRENNEEEETYEQRIQDIENRIKQTKEKLERNLVARNAQKEKLSEEYLDLENERRILKVDLLNYNYAHLRTYTLHEIQEKQRRQFEQTEREQLRRLEQQERKASLEREAEQRKAKIQQLRFKIERQQRQKKEQHDRQAARKAAKIQSSQNKNSRDFDSKISQRQEEQENGEQEQDLEQEKQQHQQDNSVQAAERKARIARIEAELASQRLRRSRQAILEAELSALRVYNYYPYSGLYSYSSSLYSDYFSYPYRRRYSLYEPFYDYSVYPYLRYRYI